MKLYQFLTRTVLTFGASTATAQRIKGGAGFVKIGVANTTGAGTILDQIALADVFGLNDQLVPFGQ